MTRLSAEEFRQRYGATTGDRIRLGDTNLWVRVQEDRTAPGDEPIWGYAKNLRMRMTQDDTAAGPSELDVLIAGVVVIDPALGVTVRPASASFIPRWIAATVSARSRRSRINW